MISIKNKENEECQLIVVDQKGRIYYETYMQPEDKLTLDIKELFTGIYTLIFKTESTSFTQQIVKY
ncbi:MAG: T9SS type A sorting domain-containing protein [Chitinophagaceae bacterium]|nr:T9SS type A sorting domain-containing protein [Chitinophagaceae bacterium]